MEQTGKSALVWTIVAEAAEFLPTGGLLFLEEAQWLDEAGLFIKGIVDAHPGWAVFATGSASFHLLARTRESLAGRATRHHLWPFSLDEATHDAPAAPPAALRAARDQAIARMLVWGSYPAAWTSDAPRNVLDEQRCPG